MENQTIIASSPSPVIPDSRMTVTVPESGQSVRLDVLLSKEFPYYSRAYFQKLIDEGSVSLNDAPIVKSGIKLKAGDRINVHFPPARLVTAHEVPENLGVKILYEHEEFFIVYKPAGLMVHPLEHKQDVVTLVDWLIQKFKEIQSVGPADRPGIVHRLDRDTSGIMIIPRNNHAHMIFSDMFKQRAIQKTYLAVVHGQPDLTGTINYPIARHPNYNKMTHTIPSGRDAQTGYTVLHYYKDSSLIEAYPTTGRTHQIRVHFAALGHPIVGDKLYGSSSKLIERQALHAHKLSFRFKEHDYTFWHDMPQDMKNLLAEKS